MKSIKAHILHAAALAAFAVTILVKFVVPAQAFLTLCCDGEETCGVGNHCSPQGQGEQCCENIWEGQSGCDYCDGGS